MRLLECFERTCIMVLYTRTEIVVRAIEGFGRTIDTRNKSSYLFITTTISFTAFSVTGRTPPSRVAATIVGIKSDKPTMAITCDDRCRCPRKTVTTMPIIDGHGCARALSSPRSKLHLFEPIQTNRKITPFVNDALKSSSPNEFDPKQLRLPR